MGWASRRARRPPGARDNAGALVSDGCQSSERIHWQCSRWNHRWCFYADVVRLYVLDGARRPAQAPNGAVRNVGLVDGQTGPAVLGGRFLDAFVLMLAARTVVRRQRFSGYVWIPDSLARPPNSEAGCWSRLAACGRAGVPRLSGVSAILLGLCDRVQLQRIRP